MSSLLKSATQPTPMLPAQTLPHPVHVFSDWIRIGHAMIRYYKEVFETHYGPPTSRSLKRCGLGLLRR